MVSQAQSSADLPTQDRPRIPEWKPLLAANRRSALILLGWFVVWGACYYGQAVLGEKLFFPRKVSAEYWGGICMIGFFDPFVGPLVSFFLASHFKRLWIVWAGAVATGTGTVLLSVISARA